MINPMSLNGKMIMIVGASSGIGADTARLLCRLGAKTVLLARREPELKALVSELGDGNYYKCVDVADVNCIDALVQEIVFNFGAIDGLVYAAGVSSTRPLKLVTSAHLHDVMSINFYPFVEFVRCISKKNMYKSGLSIVGVSSISSMQGNKGKTAYCASKSAMDSVVRCFAKELAPKLIRVNSVAPGLIKTDIFTKFLLTSDGSKDAENILSRQYMGVGETSDVANMIAYLLSSAARFVTGSTVVLDGGRLTS